MATPAKTTATYADIEALPPHLTGEIINGALVVQPRPVRRHAGAQTALSTLLGAPYQFGHGGGPGGWIFIVEAELHLGPHVLVADIVGWRRERMTKDPEEAHFHIPPDWVFEALSPSTERYDRGAKRTIYGHYGVDYLWHLEPRARLLETFERREKTWLLAGTFHDDAEVAAAPFADAPFSLGLLWPFDRPAV